ncbi:MAG: hypothetical protein AAFX90_21905 [Pseudomonadota bacterium]
MKRLYKNGKTEIWGFYSGGVFEFGVYGTYESGDPRMCPSIGMAMDVAGVSSDEAEEIIDQLPPNARG